MILLQVVLTLVTSIITSHIISLVWISILIILPSLRKIAIQTLLILFIFSFSIFFYNNFYELKSNQITPKDSIKNIFNIAFTNGSSDILSKVIIRTKHFKYLTKIAPQNKKINILASKIVKDCKSKDHYCETRKLLRFVTNKIKYRSDPVGGGDFVKAPNETLEAMAGDCEDKSILLISLLGSLGIKTYFVFADEHAYPLVCFNKRLQFASNYMIIKKNYCYHLEPTATNSKIGYYHNEQDIKFIFDPITKREIDNPNTK